MVADQGRLGGAGRQPNRPVIWGREIPYRNRNFTGREVELQALRESLTSDSASLVTQAARALYGLGGVGKTELVAEYAHRYRSEYSVVWWVRAEQPETVIISLLALGRRMQLPDFRDEEREYSLGLVRDALNRGEPYPDYLLIFDNAADPTIAEYVPEGPGHVIVTSRHSHWRRGLQAEGIEVREFMLDETVDYLRKCVPSLAVAADGSSDRDHVDTTSAGDEEARRHRLAVEVAETLDNLPLAAAHAAAYMVETGIPVPEYLDLYQENAHQLLGEEVNIDYPHSVATTWSMARGTFSEEADALFKLLAFFSSEPIYEELLVRPGITLPGLDVLERVVSDRNTFRNAVRQLGRFSMVRLDSVRNVIQVHSVVQRVTQGRLMREDPESARFLRAAAHALLAASDPIAPDRDDSEQAYQRSFQHLVPSGSLESESPQVRGLIVNQVRRLCARGGHNEALSLGEPALNVWRERFGPDDRFTLALAVETGVAMRFSGRWEDARNLNADSIERLRNQFGEAHETYLNCALSYGVDLSYLGRYEEALGNDLSLLPLYEQVFGVEHLDTLQLRNNIAVSLRCLGRFSEALVNDLAALEGRRRILGERETGTLTSKFAIARDYRRLGRYKESLDLILEVNRTLQDKGEPWNRHRLMIAADLGVALRFLGQHEHAITEGEAIHDRHIAVLGPEHRTTLRNAINLIADRRLVHDLRGARELGEKTATVWERLAGPNHPNTVAARLNLAVVLQASGNHKSAITLQERVLTDFTGIYGEDHPDTLIAMLDLASNLASIGEVRRARHLGESAYRKCVEVCGPRHPYTLAAGNNLANDRLADGDAASAQDLREQIERAFLDVLGQEHPDTRRCEQHGRILLDVEPMMN